MAGSNANPSTDIVTDVRTSTTAINNYFVFKPGVANSTSFGTTLPTDCTKTGWRSNGTLNGTFAAANWTFNVKLQNRFGRAHAGIVYVRIWKGNSDMTTATAITAWSASPNTISFSATKDEIKTDSFTVSVSETTLSSEYLFVEYIWKITSACNHINCGSYFTSDEATGETVLTTDFTPAFALSIIDWPATANFPSFEVGEGESSTCDNMGNIDVQGDDTAWILTAYMETDFTCDGNTIYVANNLDMDPQSGQVGPNYRTVLSGGTDDSEVSAPVQFTFTGLGAGNPKTILSCSATNSGNGQYRITPKLILDIPITVKACSTYNAIMVLTIFSP